MRRTVPGDRVIAGHNSGCLIAVDVLGLSYGEGSRALRIRESTITTRLYRARHRVAAMLAQESSITPVVRQAPLEVAARTTA
jgi:hypothetical protein